MTEYKVRSIVQVEALSKTDAEGVMWEKHGITSFEIIGIEELKD